MTALFSLFVIILLSITAIRIGAVALELTGLSPAVASFQAQSAFSGVGFTTSESESLVNHPTRRKILRGLILVGNAGITSSVATLVLTFVGQQGAALALRGGFLVAGLVAIMLLARSKLIYALMKKIIEKALTRWTSVDIYDYEELLGVSKGYTIWRIVVKNDSWLAGRKLKDLNLDKEGVLLLTVYHRDENQQEYSEIPGGETLINTGDVLVCYSRKEVGQSLVKRTKGKRGDQEHKEKAAEQKKISEINQIQQHQ
jgi:hypothetical protein